MLEEILVAEFRIEQLRKFLEEERRINIETQALVEIKEAKIKLLEEANAKELALLDEQRNLKNAIVVTAAEIDAMDDNNDEENDVETTSERPSTSSQKASTLDGKQKKIVTLQTIQEEDDNSNAETHNLITEAEDERLVTQHKRSLLAPHIFSAPISSRSEEHHARNSVF